MKVLLLGEYSNVHATLASGLRALGHDVTVASDGDDWKNYPRDINLARPSGALGGLTVISRILCNLHRLRGHDVVQLINPVCFALKAERIMPLYRYLRKHNGHIVLGAFGMDHYWVNSCVEDKPLRYSDFNFGPVLRDTPDARREREEWTGDTPKERLNRYMADDADAIVAGLYEYWVAYHPHFAEKTHFIPLPIRVKKAEELTRPHPQPRDLGRDPLQIFIGINRERSAYKGTDLMLADAQRLAADNPDKVRLHIAESVPFAAYTRMMYGSDLILDQLYSYTPAMNALEAMSRGIICVGGGEPESYELMEEHDLRPVINVVPNPCNVYEMIQRLIAQPEEISRLRRDGLAFIARHHDHIKVARRYERLYEALV